MVTGADSLAEKCRESHGMAGLRTDASGFQTPSVTEKCYSLMLFRRTDCVVSTDPDRLRHVRDEIRHANHYAWGLSGLTREHDLIPRTQ